MEKSSALPTTNRTELLDEDEEMATLIWIFANGSKNNQDDSRVSFNTKQSAQEINPQSSAKYAICSGINPEFLPRPSPFVRRRKSPYSAPVGPSLVKLDVEPYFANFPFHHGAHDEYGTAFDI